MRASTLVWGGLAVLAGLFLYQVKHDVQVLALLSVQLRSPSSPDATDRVGCVAQCLLNVVRVAHVVLRCARRVFRAGEPLKRMRRDGYF